MSSKASQITSVRRDPCGYDCVCGWSITNKEKKAMDLLIRLHNKKCEEGATANTKTVYTKRTINHTNGGVSAKRTVAIGFDTKNGM